MMGSDVELTSEHEQGRIYEYRKFAVYVPNGVTDRIGVNVSSDIEAVRVAAGVNQETPPGVIAFENTGARDAKTYAQLWAAVIDSVDFEDVLEWRPTVHDECWQVGIPAIIAAEGTAAMASYLATHGFTNGEIADALDVGSRTVSQYLSDFKIGER